MAEISSTIPPQTTRARWTAQLKPYLTPYYLTIIAVLGTVTVLFTALTVVLLLIATNFNVLGLIE